MAETQDLAELEMAFAKDPTSGAFIPLTQAYLGQGRFMEAMVVCKKGIKSQPDNVEGRLLLARVYAEQGKVPKAIEEVKGLLDSKPDVAAAHLFYGQMLEKTGKFEEAIEAYKQALRKDKNLAEATAALKAKGIDWAPGPTPEEIAAMEAAKKAEEDAKRQAEEAARQKAEAEEAAKRAAADAKKAAAAPAAKRPASASGPPSMSPTPATGSTTSPPAWPSDQQSFAGAYGMFSGPVPVVEHRRRLGPGFTFGLGALLLLVVVGFVVVLKLNKDTQDKVAAALKEGTRAIASDTTQGHKKGVTYFEQAVELDDDQDIGLAHRGHSLSVLAVERGEQDLMQRAKDATAVAAKKAKDHPFSVAAQMIQLRAEGRAEEAIKVAHEVNGDDLQLAVPIRIQAGRSYAALGKVPEMMKVAESLKDLSDPAALTFAGEAFRRVAEHARARTAFDGAMKNELDHDPARALRALAILESDDTVHLNVALDDLRTLKELGKDAVGTKQRGYAALGMAALGKRIGRPERDNALERENAKKELKTDPEIPLFDAKDALEGEAPEYDKAISLAEEAIKIDRVRLGPYLLIVEAAARSKKWSKADEALGQAQAVFGDNLALGLAKGERLRDEEQYDRALDALTQLKAKFDFAEVYRDMGKVMLAKGDKVGAINTLKEAAKKAGARSVGVQANVYTWLGRALAANDQHEEAIDSYGQALAATSEHTSTYFFLARSAKATGDGAKARTACTSYLKIDGRGPYSQGCQNILNGG